MPSEVEIYGALSETLQDVFTRDDLVLKAELAAKDVHGWDSFKQVEIIMAAEERVRILGDRQCMRMR